MKTKFTLLTLFLFLSTALLFATEQSQYCETPIGHLGDPQFGDPNGRALLTISKINDNSLEVILSNSPDAPAKIDFLYIAIFGMAPINVGTHDGEILSEYRAVITFTGTPPTDVKFLNIQWKNPGSPGTWTLNDLTVPFDASCGSLVADAVKPVMSSAEVIKVGPTTATLSLAATDKNDEGATTTVKNFVANDVTNNLENITLTVNSEGQATLAGLKASTTYNLDVKAKDAAGNLSENVKQVTFTTETLAPFIMIDDFEGDAKAWEALEGANPISIVANPLPEGINQSSHAMLSGRNANSNNWAAAMLRGINQPGGIYRYLHVMIYRTTFATIPNAKVSDAIGGDIAPIAGQAMIANQWQDIVFDLSVVTPNHNIEFLFFMFDRGALTEDLSCYIDDIILDNNAEPRLTTTTGVTSPKADQSAVYANDGIIYCNDCTGTVNVYNISGSLVATDASNDVNKKITIKPGIYIVKAGMKTYKIAAY